MQRKIERKAEKSNDNTYASYIDATTGEIVLVTDASAEPRSRTSRTCPTPPTRRRPRRRRSSRRPRRTCGIAVTTSRPSGVAVASRRAAGSARPATRPAIERGDRQRHRRALLGQRHRRDHRIRRTGVRNGLRPSSADGRPGTRWTSSSSAGRATPAGSSPAASRARRAFPSSRPAPPRPATRTTAIAAGPPASSCGHTASSVNGQVCTSSGCKSPVIVWSPAATSSSPATPAARSTPPTAPGPGFAATRSRAVAARATPSRGRTIAPALGLTIVTG